MQARDVFHQDSPQFDTSNAEYSVSISKVPLCLRCISNTILNNCRRLLLRRRLFGGQSLRSSFSLQAYQLWRYPLSHCHHHLQSLVSIPKSVKFTCCCRRMHCSCLFRSAAPPLKAFAVSNSKNPSNEASKPDVSTCRDPNQPLESSLFPPSLVSRQGLK